MSPRKRPTRVLANDSRTRLQMAHDQTLVGTWWRCDAHGLTHDPLILGDVTYCSEGDCMNRVFLVHRVSDDKRDVSWNDGPAPRSAKAPVATDDVESEQPAEPDQEDEVPNPPAAESRRTNAQIITEALATSPHTQMPTRELRAIFIAARPDLGARATANFDSTAQRLRAAGRLVRTPTGWALPGAAPLSSSECTEVAPPRLAPTPETVTPAPEAALDAEDSPAAQVPADFVTVRISGPMRRRLEELRDDGYCGSTIGEVAERFLARALRAFTAAN